MWRVGVYSSLRGYKRLNFCCEMLIAAYPKVGECAREGLMDKEVCINAAKGRFLGLRLPELFGGSDMRLNRSCRRRNMKLAAWCMLIQCDSRGGNHAAEVREIGDITKIAICQQCDFECAGPSANFKVTRLQGLRTLKAANRSESLNVEGCYALQSLLM
ncbi:hypothetical protein FRC0126_00279 [Corynebacterium diphtheriae]|uniref:Uncharacterized protein n=1 Tax=Corynebacterium diphtheriae (strain ATCC 700971 / NCTC 13129 / Biotype gravis) TaxID=257309 RepID=Q6NK06_CORDI|nr:hypothetical protein CIP107504_00325 [Corynebacterium diphtheriae]CAB0583581.1 hypothetical protein CIP107536_00251 [Corynebacterium diphtheriae]CAB0585042.1 hypothetical protein CIP107545_00320 [Corynebacterium diphtheriae]CAB0630950.1 hypothetical protein CIP107560_00324 [Corynebacterium diphtheriae]CAB0733496.1 hypothetical protein FRC0126_00279 [Corynebacterium diphtheriae]